MVAPGQAWSRRAQEKGNRHMAFTVKSDKLMDGTKAVPFVESLFMGPKKLPNPTKIVVMHFTFGSTANSSANWFKDPQNPGSSAHLVVERDGGVIQCVPFNIVAWHAGKSRLRNLVGLNQFAIGIELANWGYLQPIGSGWKTHTGKAMANPFMGAHKNGNPNGGHQAIGWEPYPARQFDAAVEIVRALVKEYGVDEVVGHDDIAPDRKWDPGPAFDMVRFRNLIFGDRGDNGDIRLKVVPPGGLNLRKGPGTAFEAIQLLAAGTVLDPMSQDGLWISVTVIDPSGNPDKSGWVHSKFVEPV
jgi:N-acetylmuramoyl-L-alanine amidase